MATFWTTRELRERGKSNREIRRAAESRAIRAVRKGHWAGPGVADAVLRAARLGGVATATTASRTLGIWTPPDPPPDAAVAFRRRAPDRLQVAVTRNAARLRDPDDASRPFTPRNDVVLHWVDPVALEGTSRTRIAPPLLILEHAFRSLPPERALAMLDSAIQLRFLQASDVATLTNRLPERLHEVVRAWDRAESGIETITRYFLRRLGLHVVVLPEIPGVGTVDLLVEGRVIIELDGKEFHVEEEAFDRDRRRDALAAVRRYRALRFTWYQVLFEWQTVEDAVFAALGA